MKKQTKKKQETVISNNKPISNFTKEENNDISFKNLFLAILFFAPFIVYSFGFKNEFLSWDDGEYVFKNNYILEPMNNLGKILASVCCGNYHPLTMLSLALNSLIFGTEPTSFIVINAVIHSLNTYLVYVFISKLLALNSIVSNKQNAFWIAFFSALFFGIHPMHIESVVWISERKDVLYTFFFLLSAIKYCDFLKEKQIKTFIIVFIYFVLSCLSKGMAVVLPIVLFLIDYWAEEPILSFKNIKNKAAFLIFSLFWGIVTLNVQGGDNFYGLLYVTDTTSAFNNSFSFLNKFIFAAYAVSVYIFKLFIPINLHHYYPYPFIDAALQSEHYLGVFFTISVIGALTYAFLKNKKVLFFGLAFFFITILLVLQLVSVGSAMVSERYTYVPYIGLLFILFYYTFNSIKINIAPFVGIVAIIFSVLSINYIPTWQNTISLWENSYNKGEKDLNVLLNLLDGYKNANQYDKMLKICDEGIGLKLANAKFAEYKGNYYGMKKEYSKGLEHYEMALKIPNPNKKADNTDKAEIYYNQAIIYRNLNDYSRAINSFNSSLQYDTSMTNKIKILKNRSSSLVASGQYSQALPDINTLLNIGVKTDSIFNDRAVIYFNQGDKLGAINDLKTALNLNPNNIEAQSNLKKLSSL